MIHFVALRFHVKTVVLVARRDERNLLHDAQIETVVNERFDFFRVVRHQTHFMQTQVFQDLDADAVVAQVDAVPEREVRFACVHSAVLQFVRLNFFRQTDAAPLLREVNQDADAPLVLNLF